MLFLIRSDSWSSTMLIVNKLNWANTPHSLYPSSPLTQSHCCLQSSLDSVSSFWKVLRYAGSLTDCNCSWSDIFPLSARTSMEGANFMSPKIWIRLRFPLCISPSGWSIEDLQAALYASMKIFFEWAWNLWPFSDWKTLRNVHLLFNTNTSKAFWHISPKVLA